MRKQEAWLQGLLVFQVKSFKVNIFILCVNVGMQYLFFLNEYVCFASLHRIKTYSMAQLFLLLFHNSHMNSSNSFPQNSPPFSILNNLLYSLLVLYNIFKLFKFLNKLRFLQENRSLRSLKNHQLMKYNTHISLVMEEIGPNTSMCINSMIPFSLLEPYGNLTLFSDHICNVHTN